MWQRKPEHPASDPRLPSRETAPGRATAPLPSHPDLGDEPRELRVGEPVVFDREGLDMPIMDPPLVWVELLRADFEDSIEQLIKSDNAPAQRTLAVAHLDGW